MTPGSGRRGRVARLGDKRVAESAKVSSLRMYFVIRMSYPKSQLGITRNLPLMET